MSKIILLDAGPLGLITNPRGSEASQKCVWWMEEQIRNGARVMVPEITDYEVRRELLRAGKTKGVASLNALKSQGSYLPLTTEVMLKAAELWAYARSIGKPTAGDAELDCDVILAAQGHLLQSQGHTVVVATANLRHLSLFIDARLWNDIT